LDLAPYGWLDALRGRYVRWFGEVLHCFPGWLSGKNDCRPFERSTFCELWRHAGFCLWERERVEALKGLGMFGGQLNTGMGS
jgi:hypothetical protein